MGVVLGISGWTQQHNKENWNESRTNKINF